MTTYFKAVKEDGTAFYGGINYLTDQDADGVIRHPNPGRKGSSYASGYLSISTEVTDCTGFRWPARLLEVEAVGNSWTPNSESLPHKRAVKALRVVRELDAKLLLGPQADHLIALLARIECATADEIKALAARDAARDAARGAAWDAARGAAWDAARDAAWDAARALIMRDQIGVGAFTQAHYDELSQPWRETIGKIHPDDEDMK